MSYILVDELQINIKTNLNKQLGIYDKQKGLKRRICGDHDAITLLKNCRDTAKHFEEEEYAEGLFDLLLKYKFAKDDKELSYNIYQHLKKLCANYYYEKATNIWNQEEQKNIPLKDRTIKYCQNVHKLLYKEPTADINEILKYKPSNNYTRIYDLACSQLDKINNARSAHNTLISRIRESEQKQNNYRKILHTLEAPLQYMPNKLPHPPYTSRLDMRRVIVPYKEFETNYIEKLTLCNNKISEYNNQVTYINTTIRNNSPNCTIEWGKSALSRIKRELETLQQDLDNYTSTFCTQTGPVKYLWNSNTYIS